MQIHEVFGIAFEHSSHGVLAFGHLRRPLALGLFQLYDLLPLRHNHVSLGVSSFIDGFIAQINEVLRYIPAPLPLHQLLLYDVLADGFELLAVQA